MATAGKTYVVEDADKNAGSDIPPGIFPGTLQGLLDALDAARYRSAAGTPKALIIVEGKQRQIIRRYEHGVEAWPASQAEIRREHLRQRRAVEPAETGSPGTVRVANVAFDRALLTIKRRGQLCRGASGAHHCENSP
jgi:hypothetical protein